MPLPTCIGYGSRWSAPIGVSSTSSMEPVGRLTPTPAWSLWRPGAASRTRADTLTSPIPPDSVVNVPPARVRWSISLETSGTIAISVT